MATSFNETEPPQTHRAADLPEIRVTLGSVKPGQIVIYRPFEFVTFSDFYGVRVGPATNLEKRPLPYLVLKKEGSSLLTVPIDLRMAKSLEVSGIEKELWKYLVPIKPKIKESHDQLEPLVLVSTGKYEGWLDIRRIVEIRPDSLHVQRHSGSIRMRHTNLDQGDEEKKLLDNLLNAARCNEGETKERYGKLLAAAEKRQAETKAKQHASHEKGRRGRRRRKPNMPLD